MVLLFSVWMLCYFEIVDALYLLSILYSCAKYIQNVWIICKYSTGLVTGLLSVEKSMMENTNIKYSAQRNKIGAGCALFVIIHDLTNSMPDEDILQSVL